MKLTPAIQEALLALLCYDETTGGAALVASLLAPGVYDPYFRDLAEEASAYFLTYGKAPGEHTLDIIQALKERHPDRAEIYQRIFTSLKQTRRGVNREYVTHQAQLFARHQSLKAGITAAIDQLQDGNESAIAEAENALRTALDANRPLLEAGTLLSDPQRALRFLDASHAAYPTGIPRLDERGLGPARKRLHVFVALPGRGKTWWLVHLAKQALMNRLRVVYVTLELSEEEVASRLMQALFSIAKRGKEVHQYQVFESDELGRFVGMDVKALSNRPGFNDPRIRRHLTAKLKVLKHKPPLVIKEFPTGSLTVRELEAYLHTLEAGLNVIPDLLIVDYADLMAVDAKNYRTDLGLLYKQLRGVAVKRNVAVATASQAHRNAARARVMTAEHIAEDYSKVATADVVLTYSQTPSEYELGLARLFVAKGRTDRDKFAVLISQAYGLGQFCMDSASMVSSYWSKVNEQGNGTEEEASAPEAV